MTRAGLSTFCHDRVRQGRAACLAVAALALSGCAIESASTAYGATPTSTTLAPTAEEGLLSAVSSFAAAHSDGDPSAAWAIVSDRCRQVVDGGRFRNRVMAYSMMYPPFTATDATVELHESEGMASYSFGIDDIRPVANERWAKDASDHWRWNDC